MLRRDKTFDLRRTRRQNERQLAVTSPAWAWPASLRPQLVHPRRGPHRHLTSAPTCKPTVSVARANQSVTQRSGSRKNWPNGVDREFRELSAVVGARAAEGPGTSFVCPHGAGGWALCALSSSSSSKQAWWRGPALTLRRASPCATAVGNTSAGAPAIAAIRHIITVLTAGIAQVARGAATDGDGGRAPWPTTPARHRLFPSNDRGPMCTNL